MRNIIAKAAMLLVMSAVLMLSLAKVASATGGSDCEIYANSCGGSCGHSGTCGWQYGTPITCVCQ
jgi:hypothetical protein